MAKLSFFFILNIVPILFLCKTQIWEDLVLLEKYLSIVFVHNTQFSNAKLDL